jgi:TRAP transporter 4TM/12TM fusion protein
MEDENVSDPGGSNVQTRLREYVTAAISIAVCLFVLIEVNFSLLTPLRSLALFATAGVVLSILQFPMVSRCREWLTCQLLDWVLVALAIGCCGYLLYHGSELGQRAALYGNTDLAVGAVGLLLIWESTRRAIGLAVPILALIFVIYAHESVAQHLPDWLFPHRGQDWQSMIGQLYLRTEGVFGTALSVMFKYVFLFVLFGALLEASGATQYIIQMALRFLGNQSGGPAKVSVVASGLMGSLSGSAVANAATTGVFTIPLMRSVGFKPHIAAAIEAAASSGGALAPPVMGAGAYMMLEIINRQPPVTYLEIMRAAIIPAMLFYLSLFLLVHFYSKRLAATPERASNVPADQKAKPADASSVGQTQSLPVVGLEGITFFGALGGLIALLLDGSSPFRAVTFSLAFILGMIIVNPRTPAGFTSRLLAGLTWAALIVACKFGIPQAQRWPEALIWSMAGLMLVGLCAKTWRSLILNSLIKTASSGVPLIVVAACVGMVIGLVSRTGIGTGVPQAIIPLAGDNLFLGLLAIMGCSLLLGMGLPSAVSYLLLATIIGPVFADPALGVPILAAHLFIFYFGMMAMVTPPVALAGYATASIAGASVMRTSFAAFRFSLVGFTLPFMFVYRPALCLIGSDNGTVDLFELLPALLAALIGIFALSSALAGYLFSPLKGLWRWIMFSAAGCALFPDQFNLLGRHLQLFDLLGAALLAIVAGVNYSQARHRGSTAE